MADLPQFPTTRPAAGDWAKLTIGGITKIWDPATKSYQLPGTINKRLAAQGLPLIKVPGIAPRPPAQGTPTPPAQGTPAPSTPAPTTPAPGTPTTPAPGTPAPSTPAPTSPAPGTPTPPAQGTPAPSAPAPAPPAQGTPAPSTPAPTRPTQSSPANLPTAEKIKSGLSVYDQQVKMGDVKGAESTGRGVWAMANPKLAAAADERARIRGTAQTDNPLMKDFRSRLPVTPSIQSPTLQSTIGNTKGYQSLLSNPNAAVGSNTNTSGASATPLAARPINPNATATAFSPNTGNLAARVPLAVRSLNQNITRAAFAPSTGNLAARSGSTPTATPATRPTATPAARPTQRASSIKPIPRGGQQRSALLNHYEYEPYDILLDYLISRGHADNLTEANYLMLEMDQGAIQTVMEDYQNYLLSEEISEWINNVIYEGHDLSGYTIEELVEYYITEKYGTKKGRKKLAKKIHAGKDVGKKGAGFEKIVDKASPKYGKEKATKIAAAAMWKNLGK